MEELQSRNPGNNTFFSSEEFGLKSDIAELFHSLNLDIGLDVSNQVIERKVEQNTSGIYRRSKAKFR